MSRRVEAQYSERMDEALAFVAAAFRHHIRKGSGAPYLSHLLQVAATVAEHGGDEEQIVAALCHDYLEDIRGAQRDELARRFGDRVARLVEGLSDSTGQPRPPWKERKLAYVTRLAAEPAELKLICAADKLHNASAIVRDRRVIGDRIWERFTPTREECLWYYRGVVASLGTNWEHALLEELRRTVDDMHVG